MHRKMSALKDGFPRKLPFFVIYVNRFPMQRKSVRNLGQVYWCTGQQRLHTSKDSIFVTMGFYKFLKSIFPLALPVSRAPSRLNTTG